MSADPTTPTTPAALRRGPGAAYTPTHAERFQGNGRWVRSCGKCGRHTQVQAGQRRHRLFGALCSACSAGSSANGTPAAQARP